MKNFSSGENNDFNSGTKNLSDERFLVFYSPWYPLSREDKGDREGIPDTHSIPLVIRLELFLESG